MIRIEDELAPGGTLLPDLTPLLDVIFIVLVFLLLSANVAPRALQLDLPKDADGVSEQAPTTTTITLSIDPHDNSWALDGKRYHSFDELKQAVTAAFASNPKAELVIAADKTVQLERFMQLVTWLQQQGHTQSRILMESDE